MNIHEAMKRERDTHGISIFEAYHRVKQRQLLEELAKAKTVEDLHPIILDLVMNTRFTNGGPRG